MSHYLNNIFSGSLRPADIREACNILLKLESATGGPAIADYEAAWSKTLACTNVFSYAAGRMAFYALLEAMGIGEGDEVVIPAFTCVVVPNAILYRGAIPVYVDIDPTTFNINAEEIQRKITPRTRAILAQHTFGLPCNLAAIRSLAAKRGIDVIEDLAHAAGVHAGSPSRPELRRILYLSTDHTKLLSTGTGGIAATDDPELAGRLAILHARTPFLNPFRVRRIVASLILEYALTEPRVFRAGKYLQSAMIRAGAAPFFLDEALVRKPTSYPYPARLSNLQARIGLLQLADLPNNISHRRRLATRYDQSLGLYKEHLTNDAPTHVFLRYSFMVTNRIRFIDLVRPHLEMGIWFTSVTGGRSTGLDQVGYTMGSCPKAERICRHIVNLPTHYRISDVDWIVGCLDRLRPTDEPLLLSL